MLVDFIPCLMAQISEENPIKMDCLYNRLICVAPVIGTAALVNADPLTVPLPFHCLPSRKTRLSSYIASPLSGCSKQYFGRRKLWLKNFKTINLHSSAPLNEEGLMNRKLPEELILRIFSYLDIVSLCRCAQVCRTWNILALDGSNWQNVDLFQFQKDIKTGSKKTLSQTKNSSKVVNFNFVTVKQIVVSANCTLGRDVSNTN
ncbi:F-box/LRR-repeat protein 2 [Trichinella spiralis]|uniref:F-box/LRR-repeat protein 2 n=1 Tax=Trichinella spiralis TaxID=6334 RepID=UPI0001EFD823|nr:F-box/LRR-repeat protein 2 [Trichinella spiralis]